MLEHRTAEDRRTLGRVEHNGISNPQSPGWVYRKR